MAQGEDKTTDAADGGTGSEAALARAYFDYALSGILETDRRWRVSRANAAAASITGYERRSLPGRTLSELFVAASTDRGTHYLTLLQEQGMSSTELQMRRADGAEITTTLESVQVADDLYIHIFDDVTAQRRAAAELQAAREAAEAANRAKTAFLASISHEIRTPMNGILGLAQLASTTPLTPEQREYVDKIAQSGRTLLKVINGLLDFAKIEAGKMEFECIPFTLDEMLDELATIAQQADAADELEVVFDLQPDVPMKLVGDRLRLGQVLTNLLGNALKFTSSGRVELQIAIDRAQPDAVWIRFEVRDTGIGIDGDTMARLFEPFSQAEAATTRRFGGTGLGLAIARELATGMGGELSASSEPGVGSCFTLRLPFRRAGDAGMREPEGAGRRARVAIERRRTRAAVTRMLQAEGFAAAAATDAADLVVVDLADTAPPPVGDDAAPLLALAGIDAGPALDATGTPRTMARTHRPLTPGGLRRALRELGLGASAADDLEALVVPDEFAGTFALVAEDGEVNQLVLLNLLHKAGIRTRLATDGQAVLEFFTAPPAAPDVVLMDVQMPAVDGLEATRELRRRGVEVPIIGVSAGSSTAEEQACLDAGMNDFLPKPIDADELWGCLTRWVRPRQPDDSGEPRVGAEARFLGDRASLARARAVFASSHAGDAARLAAAHARSDRDTMARVAHALKGAAATVGADDIAGLARLIELEMAGRGVAGTGVDELLRRLEAALNKVRDTASDR